MLIILQERNLLKEIRGIDYNKPSDLLAVTYNKSR